MENPGLPSGRIDELLRAARAHPLPVHLWPRLRAAVPPPRRRARAMAAMLAVAAATAAGLLVAVRSGREDAASAPGPRELVRTALPWFGAGGGDDVFPAQRLLAEIAAGRRR